MNHYRPENATLAFAIAAVLMLALCVIYAMGWL